MTELVEFKALLESLQSPENDIRSNAERTYETIPIPSKFNYLMSVISKLDEDPKNRIFSGVLCRRLLDVSYEEAFECLSGDHQDNIKRELLQLIINETTNTVRKKLSDITIEVAKHQFSDDGVFMWHDLLNFIFNICINNSNESLKVTGLHLFTSLPNVLPVTQQENLNIVGTTLTKCLSATNEAGAKQSIEVRESATKALCSFIITEYEDNLKVCQLRSLIPLMLQAIVDSIQENPYDDNIMKSFIELVDEVPGFLKANISQILQLCINIIQNDQIEEPSQKHLAIEIFISLSETSTNAVRKCSNLSHTIIQYLFKMLTDIEDDPNWSNIDEEEIDDDSTNHVTAEIALDRLAIAMRGKRLLEEVTQTVPAMLHSPDWKQRHGGLKAISSMGEGLMKVMSDILGQILSEVVQLLADPHPRVRYAASVCLGQMSSDFEPKLQSSYHDTVMPALIAVLDDTANPRVQAYACSALTNFCEGTTKDVLGLYLPVLAEKLLQVLNSKCTTLNDGKKLVLEQVVTTIAAVSDTAGSKFEPYYSSFMPIMKWIMQYCQQDHLRLLRGKSIECISLMGLAVGKEKFMSDATDVMNLLMMTQSTSDRDMSADDPQHSYMISAWARICKLMGREFAQYLEFVMGPVLKTASMKPETCFMYDEDTEDMSADKDWQVVRVGQDQNVAINTSGIEDKINACQMLICYARELKDAFAPYVVEVTKIMLPLLKFYLNDDVRSAAADIIPFLIESARPLGDRVRAELWEEMVNGLLQALKAEEEKIQQADMLGAIADGIEKMGAGCMSQERLECLIEIMKKAFDDLFANQDARAAKRKSDDYDDEEEEALDNDKDDDDNILAKLVGITHSLFKVYRLDALGFFQQISHYVIKLLDPSRPWTDLQYGLCFLDDLLEFTGPDSWQYCNGFLHVFQLAIEHPQPEVRQAAAYGFGLMAMYGGPEYHQFLSQVSITMVRLMTAGPGRAQCRDDDSNLSTENVISALTKICKYQPNCVPGGDVNQFLPVWLSWLPVYEDEEETPHVYGYLCELLEANNPAIIGADNSNLVTVVKAIAACINKEALMVDNDVYRRCLAIIRMIQANEQLFTQCVQNLSDDEKICLKQALDKTAN